MKRIAKQTSLKRSTRIDWADWSIEQKHQHTPGHGSSLLGRVKLFVLLDGLSHPNLNLRARSRLIGLGDTGLLHRAQVLS
jgi:hypothetical protein